MFGLVAAFTNSTSLEPPMRQAMDRMHRRSPDGEGFWQEERGCLERRNAGFGIPVGAWLARGDRIKGDVGIRARARQLATAYKGTSV